MNIKANTLHFFYAKNLKIVKYQENSYSEIRLLPRKCMSSVQIWRTLGDTNQKRSLITLVCCKRWLNRTVRKMRSFNRSPLFGTIKIPPCSKDVSTKNRSEFCSHSMVMVIFETEQKTHHNPKNYKWSRIFTVMQNSDDSGANVKSSGG